jgi:lipoprotein-releasing system permease protein
MRANLSLLLGWRYSFGIARQRLLSFLSRVSSAGLALGVAMLILVLSVMNGFQRELEERILNLVPQASLISYYGLPDWQSRIVSVEQHPEVLAAAPFTKVQAMLSVRNNVVPMLGFGVDPDYEIKVSAIAEFVPNLSSLLAISTHLVIGQGLASELALQKGDSVVLIVPDRDESIMPKLQRMTVAEIFVTGTELDNQVALMPLAMANNLRGIEGAEGLRLKLGDLFAARRVSWQLQHASLGYDFISDWSNSHGNLYHAVRMSRNMVTLLLFVIVLVAVFNVVSALVMGVKDKASEIAILRTMGASRGLVMRSFIVQGFAIGVVGVGSGVGLGVLLSLMAPNLVTFFEKAFGTSFLNSHIYPISYLPSDLRLADIVMVASLSMLICLVATILPAWRASRLKPAEVLRGD